ARTSAKLLPKLDELVVIQGAGRNDLRRGLAAVLGSEPAERSDDRLQLVLAAVAGEHAKEVGRDWIELKLRRNGFERLACFLARHQRARDQLIEILRIGERLVERVETVADRLDLPLVMGKIEQR